jgi:hypothetical protein
MAIKALRRAGGFHLVLEAGSGNQMSSHHKYQGEEMN